MLELPSWRRDANDGPDTLALVERWLTSRPLNELVHEFGGSLRGGGIDADLEYLERFSKVHWDFRGGRERNLAEQVTFGPARSQLILDCTKKLGMTPSFPLSKRYDTLLMTGGMVRAGIVKPRFAKSLIDSGVQIGSVVFLGGFREFAGDEEEVARALGVNGNNEFDAMVAGMERAFGPLGAPQVRGLHVTGTTDCVSAGNAWWCEYSWRATGIRLSVVAAPSSAPEYRRANTEDTYRFWAESRQHEDEQSVLIVTTPIYVPYQGAGAVEIFGLEFGLAVETVGISAETADLGELSQVFNAQHHLQELRAAIVGMRSLRRRLLTGSPAKL